MLYGGRTEDMCLHYKQRDDETIQYVDVMKLHPHICKYYKIPIGQPKIHVGNACEDIESCITMEGQDEVWYHPAENLSPRPPVHSQNFVLSA
jgi:hypothetical protein